jgi:hypothetical protein
MLFGWRMWKVCVVISFGLVGFGVAYHFIPVTEPDRLWYSIGAGVLLAAAAFYPVKFAICVLGGLIAAGVIHLYLQALNLDEGVVWAGAGAAFVGGTALLITGLAAWMIAFPGFFNSARFLAERSAIVIPFVLGVPTVMSCFYQIAEIHRLQAEG